MARFLLVLSLLFAPTVACAQDTTLVEVDSNDVVMVKGKKPPPCPQCPPPDTVVDTVFVPAPPDTTPELPFAPDPPAPTRVVPAPTRSALVTAVANAQAGDEIQIPGGSLGGGSSILAPNGRGGTAAKPIVIRCMAPATIDGPGRTGGYVFRFRGPYWQIRGPCTLRRAGFIVWVEPTPGTPRGPDPVGVVVDGVTFEQSDRNGMIFNGAHRSYLQRCKVRDIGNTAALSTEGVYVGTSSTTAPWLMSDSVKILGCQFGPNVRGEDVDVKGYPTRRSTGTLVRGVSSDATGKVFCAHGTGCGPSNSGAFSDQGGLGTRFVDDTVKNINSANLNGFWFDTSQEAVARRNRAVVSENTFSGTGTGFNVTTSRRSQTTWTIFCDNEGPMNVGCTE